MKSQTDFEAAVQACYSTWSQTYYDEYYGPGASYPPVHRELIKRLLREAGVKTLLDAGCGPASFLREVAGEGIQPYGFDVTVEMVSEARKVLAQWGISDSHVWQGSVLSPEAYQCPAGAGPELFDAAICIGVLPHIPAEADVAVLRNLARAVRKGGLVVVEARNQLFALFTLNRYSHQFFLDELIRGDRLKETASSDAGPLATALADLEKQFRMDQPPVRKGKAGEPGYDEVLSRAHNPLVLRQQFADAGFRDVRLLFYHYHCLPPMLAATVPELFRRESLKLENPYDWRGYFMASAFLVAGRRA
jgi:2-polyprenyl-3-methyl-5-hydroxy-6-metoxy-1,4-benzoquinol methylase